MEANKRRSVAPFYAVAVLWLAYALLFPLYEPLHYGLLGMASAAVFVVVSLLCRGRSEGICPCGGAEEGGRALHRQCGVGQDDEGRAAGHRGDETAG